MGINLRISREIRGGRAIAPTARQLEAYTGLATIEAAPAAVEVLVASTAAGRLTAGNSRRFRLQEGASHQLVAFLEAGLAADFLARVVVTLEGGRQEKAAWRQIGNLVDLVVVGGEFGGEVVFTHRFPLVE